MGHKPHHLINFIMVAPPQVGRTLGLSRCQPRWIGAAVPCLSVFSVVPKGSNPTTRSLSTLFPQMLPGGSGLQAA